MQIWKKHFEAHLNTEFLHDDEAIDSIPGALSENDSDDFIVNLPDVEKAVSSVKNRKAPGLDLFTAEVLKAGGKIMVSMLHKIFEKILHTEDTPSHFSSC